jgi:MFS transporter, DHA3 family, macrolide efflux protein
MNNVTPGMRAFGIVWFGQLISQMGTAMSRFALMIWVWEQTGQATATMLTGVSATIPSILLSFVAGTLVDRWDRKWVIIASDLAAGVSTIAILILFSTDNLQLWHLYVMAAVAGGAGTFQHLAYSASISLMLPKEQYARASGLNSLSVYGSKIGAPLLAGLLIGVVGLAGILLIDIITFLFAVGALLVIRIPKPPRSEAHGERRHLLHESMLGFRYIFARRGLLGLLVIALVFSAAESFGYPLILPMILARTGGDEVALGSVQAMLGVGGVIGAVLLTAWGGPRRKIHGVLIGLALTGLLGDALMGIGQSLPAWLAAAFFLEVFIPTMLGSYQAIWQSKVAPEFQGRVFAARTIIATAAEPVAMILTGVLSDRVFEPALMPGGSLTPILGGLVGTGAGAGMGLLLVLAGVGSGLAGLAGYAFRPIREVEAQLPDHQSDVKVMSQV